MKRTANFEIAPWGRSGRQCKSIRSSEQTTDKRSSSKRRAAKFER